MPHRPQRSPSHRGTAAGIDIGVSVPVAGCLLSLSIKRCSYTSLVRPHHRDQTNWYRRSLEDAGSASAPTRQIVVPGADHVRHRPVSWDHHRSSLRDWLHASRMSRTVIQHLARCQHVVIDHARFLLPLVPPELRRIAALSSLVATPVLGRYVPLTRRS